MFTIPKIDDRTATIAISTTTSDVIENVFSQAVGIILPTMTGTAITFTVSNDRDGDYVALNNSSGAVSLTTASSKAYKLPDDLKPFPYFKLVSGSSEAAARTITVVRKS
jgi:hypothetical protein